MYSRLSITLSIVFLMTMFAPANAQVANKHLDVAEPEYSEQFRQASEKSSMLDAAEKAVAAELDSPTVAATHATTTALRPNS